MNTTAKIQRTKIGTAGSFHNQLMGNNSTIPVAGQMATIMMYTDRHVVEVIEVSKDGKTVTINDLRPKQVDWQDGYCGNQRSDFESEGNKPYRIVWRNGAWRNVCQMVSLTDAAMELSNEDRQKLFDDETCYLKLVPGLTFVKKSFPKISILFGVAKYYRDPSF